MTEMVAGVTISVTGTTVCGFPTVFAVMVMFPV